MHILVMQHKGAYGRGSEPERIYRGQRPEEIDLNTSLTVSRRSEAGGNGQ